MPGHNATSARPPHAPPSDATSPAEAEPIHSSPADEPAAVPDAEAWARLLERERRARAEAERRAHAEAALRRVARALGAALDVREAVQRISEGAVETTRAFGAYVERFDTPRPGSYIEVVAAAGAARRRSARACRTRAR
jgi:hypothetical protein